MNALKAIGQLYDRNGGGLEVKAGRHCLVGLGKYNLPAVVQYMRTFERMGSYSQNPEAKTKAFGELGRAVETIAGFNQNEIDGQQERAKALEGTSLDAVARLCYMMGLGINDIVEKDHESFYSIDYYKISLSTGYKTPEA